MDPWPAFLADARVVGNGHAIPDNGVVTGAFVTDFRQAVIGGSLKMPVTDPDLLTNAHTVSI